MAIETSAPEIFSTGPIHLFAVTPAHTRYSGSVSALKWYLGTCETQPQVKHAKMKEDVFNDLGGRKIPFQQLEQGEVAVLGFLLTRFSQAAYLAIRKAGGLDGAGTGAAGAGVGYESSYNRGAFTFGQTSVGIWMLNQFGFGAYTPGAAGPSTGTGLPRGRYYPNCVLGAHEMADSGTGAEKLLLVFNAMPQWLGFGASGDKKNAFALYSELEADFPSDIVMGNAQ